MTATESGSADNSVIELAGAIRVRRKAFGLTQQELADLAEVSARFVYDLENGKSSVALDRLMRVAEALGLELKLEARNNG
jgi:y4mF family transcriptional regulator